MDSLSNSLFQLAGQFTKRAAPEQGGIISGDNPTVYNASDPLRLWVIQVVIIISMTQLLSLILSRIRQPRVIAEVIGGIILGPTVMGRIPGFQKTIFPAASIPLLYLTANIGLVLFLFLVGLEIDTRIIKRNAKASSTISIAGLIVPLGMGAGLGVLLYREFVKPTVNFGYFILFTAVAVGITAFPVLCRILTELKLLDTTVGIVTLSAGIGNDVVGWILLALTVALVNAANGLTALWVLLAGVAFVIFLLYPVRWLYVWLARKTGSLSTGQPTAFMMTVTLLIVFASAFFTDVIGIHAIFGGFLAGLIIPHENGFAIALVEKFEDLVSILFLPLYFAYSGLRTNLGLLNNGTTWGYTILICLFAFVSKFVACGAAAKLSGFNIRESGAIGSLMSCKGLVELIVLNVGLQAGILDERVFSMFVVHALVLTFMTTPLALLFYPESCRTHAGYSSQHKAAAGEEGAQAGRPPLECRTKFSVVLDRIDQLSAAMTLTQLLQPLSAPSVSSSRDIRGLGQEEKEVGRTNPAHECITIDALRLIELTDRTSAVLKSQAADVLLHSDPVISVFRTFGYLNRLPVSAALSVVSYNEFSVSVANHVREFGSHMLLLPWTRSGSSSAPGDYPSGTAAVAPTPNPFDSIFKQSPGQDQTSSSAVYSEFVRKVFVSSPCDVGLFVDRGITLTGSGSFANQQHLFLPFFGGPDDRLALTFVVQLCNNRNVTATVVMMEKTEAHDLTRTSTSDNVKSTQLSVVSQYNTHGVADTVYGHRDTQTRLASETADTLIWNKYTKRSDAHSPMVASALTRITFETKASPQPLHAMLTLASEQAATATALIIVVGRSRRMAVESHKAELRTLVAEKGSAGFGGEVAKTLGDVGAAVVVGGVPASLLVLQASGSSNE